MNPHSQIMSLRLQFDAELEEAKNAAYSEGRKDEREASCVDELVDTLKLLIDIENGGHSGGMFRERLYAGMNKARAVLTKLEKS